MIQNQDVTLSDPALKQAFYDWLKAEILQLIPIQ